jgi:hypothetical protein
MAWPCCGGQKALAQYGDRNDHRLRLAELKLNNEEITAANEKLRELDALKSKF